MNNDFKKETIKVYTEYFKLTVVITVGLFSFFFASLIGWTNPSVIQIVVITLAGVIGLIFLLVSGVLFLSIQRLLKSLKMSKEGNTDGK